ncbi:MAG: NAD(P)-dependent oxidoreductase [Muribaculaceae bacterium]|nr:NAD(P)-dependent oxidoreductase [Muribaculaceae bacterium]
MRILITGAGGFIGGFLVQEALRRGHETWAAVRKSTSREFLRDERIHFVELDFEDEEALAAALRGAINEMGAPWDYIVHNLGATKAKSYLDFENVNYGYMRLLAVTLKDLDAMPRVFLLMSSLSVMGPGDEENYTPIKSDDVPTPNTYYGTSKLKAESYLTMQPTDGTGLPWTIFRCTGVYGPHERDYYLMMKSIKRGFDFSVGYKKQLLTFIYVEDLAVAVMDALERGPLRKAYFISEPRSYTQQEFRQIVLKALGKKRVLPVVCPLWLVKAVCSVNEFISRFTGKPQTLNRDKYKILKQRNWQCDTSDAARDFNFAPAHDLATGVAKAIAWYRQAGWL